MTELNYCPSCGADLGEFAGATFCPGCGNEVGGSQPAESGQASHSRKEGMDGETKKRTLAKLANSDRPSAPIYAEKYRRDYGEEPEVNHD